MSNSYPPIELWYCPKTKQHCFVKFSTENVDEAIDFSKDVISVCRSPQNGELLYYKLDFRKYKPSWESMNIAIPPELEAMALITL